jgi:hypothetical protein
MKPFKMGALQNFHFATPTITPYSKIEHPILRMEHSFFWCELSLTAVSDGLEQVQLLTLTQKN